MSLRLFKSFNNFTNSEYIEKIKNQNTITLNKTIDPSNNPCYKIGLCNTESIQNYTTLQKYETYYNYNRYDSSGNIIINFNGQMNHSNKLSLDISTSICLVKQMENGYDASCNHIKINEGNTDTANNLLQIDMSGLVFNFDTCSKWLSNYNK
jgi:hypothetical protein